MLLGWALHLPAYGTLAWTWRGLAWGVAATAPLVLGLFWLLRTPWRPAVHLLQVVRDSLAPLFAGAAPWELILLALLAGFGEEALFRGVLQPLASRHVSAPFALGATALLFGLVHWVTPLYAVLATLVGAYLGALLLASGTLLAPITTHAMYDMVALALLTRLAAAADRPG